MEKFEGVVKNATLEWMSTRNTGRISLTCVGLIHKEGKVFGSDETEMEIRISGEGVHDLAVHYGTAIDNAKEMVKLKGKKISILFSD